MSEISVVHLVWGPHGVPMLEDFIASYRRHPAGAEHELVIIYNGLESDEQHDEYRTALDGVEHRELVMPKPVMDLDAYLYAARHSEAERILFCNSYTRILADNWLELMDRHCAQPDIGMVACTGSYEGIRGSVKLTPRTSWTLLFPKFPNPHLRSNVFMLERKLLFEIKWKHSRDKMATLFIENGHNCLTAQIRKRGLRCVVAGRDGVAYDSPDWEAATTFRKDEQENLIIADNRTDQYADGDEDTRKFLRKLAWGHE